MWAAGPPKEVAPRRKNSRAISPSEDAGPATAEAVPVSWLVGSRSINVVYPRPPDGHIEPAVGAAVAVDVPPCGPDHNGVPRYAFLFDESDAVRLKCEVVIADRPDAAGAIDQQPIREQI
jgi:hypothetical protein